MNDSAAPVRSMTGYATLRQETSAGELTVSLRSVNHRGLDLHFHLGPELARFENAMRTLLKGRIGRGHVEVRASLARGGGSESGAYNREVLARYLSALRQAAREHDLEFRPDLNALVSLPGLFVEPERSTVPEEGFEPEIVTALSACADALNEYRGREGRELVAQLVVEVNGIESKTAEIARIRKTALHQFHARLRERLEELLASSGMSDSRLAEEAAIIADRSDVHEELTRLAVHAQELRRILEAGGEVGKRMDFLLQEMNRETNTVLSKTSGAGETGLTITNLALAVKAHIERIREQALNLE